MTPSDGMELIGFGDVHGAGKLASTLSASGNLVEAAANLFDRLHAADTTGAGIIGVAPVPLTGLEEAINDRLIRAAALPDPFHTKQICPAAALLRLPNQNRVAILSTDRKYQRNDCVTTPD